MLAFTRVFSNTASIRNHLLATSFLRRSCMRRPLSTSFTRVPSSTRFFVSGCARSEKGKRTYTSTSSVGMDKNEALNGDKGQLFRLAPSDFAFLWEECKRCFYLKSHGILYRPRAPFPSIFGTIDMAMKRHFRGLRTTDILPQMRPGVFLCEEQDAWVESQPFYANKSPVGEQGAGVFIRGMIDCLVHFDDDTYGIIDFKTSSLSEKSIAMYSRQLHAYAMALENPSPASELQKCRISDLGLIIYNPSDFHTPATDENKSDGGVVKAALTGNLKYLHIKRDDDKFQTFLTSIADVLTLPNAPSSPPRTASPYSPANATSSCTYCDYVNKVNRLKQQ